MNEFLNENARRAYPLSREWPSDTSGLRTRLLVDACIGYAGRITENPVSLLSLSCSKPAGGTASLVLGIGCSSADKIDVTLTAGLDADARVFAASASYKVILGVSGTAVDTLIAALADGTTETVGVPFALRCVSSANRRVESVSAYSAPLCETPPFSPSDTPAKTVTGGHLILGVKEGLDLETTEIAPLSGEVLRLSAISAPAATEEDDTESDLMLRGDACFTVETIPGVKAVTDSAGHTLLEKRTTSDTGGILGGGVIRLGTVCKPCCQCEDYEGAVTALRPAETAAEDVLDELDTIKGLYDAAVSTFNAAKAAALAAINAYANVHVRATATVSGGVYSGSTASGSRQRLSVTLLLTNMTLQTAAVTCGTDASDAEYASGTRRGFHIPGYTLLKTFWQRSGSADAAGTTRPVTLSLAPGDTLSVVATYTCIGNSNTAAKPSGMTATVSITLPDQSAHGRTVDIT